MCSSSWQRGKVKLVYEGSTSATVNDLFLYPKCISTITNCMSFFIHLCHSTLPENSITRLNRLFKIIKKIKLNLHNEFILRLHAWTSWKKKSYFHASIYIDHLFDTINCFLLHRTLLNFLLYVRVEFFTEVW